jgi:hypothetical protein
MAGAIVNPRVLNIARPNARLRARQRIIRARMGYVTPPPAVAPRGTTLGGPAESTHLEPDAPVEESESPPVEGAEAAPEATPQTLPEASSLPGVPAP